MLQGEVERGLAIARSHSFYGEFKMAGKKKLPYVGSKLPCAVIRTESFGEVEQP